MCSFNLILTSHASRTLVHAVNLIDNNNNNNNKNNNNKNNINYIDSWIYAYLAPLRLLLCRLPLPENTTGSRRSARAIRAIRKNSKTRPSDHQPLFREAKKSEQTDPDPRPK